MFLAILNKHQNYFTFAAQLTSHDGIEPLGSS